MSRRHFIARMPDEPGALHRAAAVVKRHGGNVERIHFDRRIDRNTVFFEVECDDRCFDDVKDELGAMGYIRTDLPEPAFLRFSVLIPNVPGALFELLDAIADAGPNIAFLDFDSSSGERLEVALTLEDSSLADVLLTALRGTYPLEILEHSTTGDSLDDTVFYLRFAQRLRPLIPAEEGFVLELMRDVNHIVQELNRRGEDPHRVFDSIIETGETLRSTTGDGFHCDVQDLVVRGTRVVCLQPPCGGNVYAVSRDDGWFMVDSGYGIYHDDVIASLATLGLTLDRLVAVLLTHGDADHAGGAVHMGAPVRASTGTVDVMLSEDRAHGSRLEGTTLESVYSRLIDLFSDFSAPDPIPFETRTLGARYGLEVICETEFVGTRVEVLMGLGGHQVGQVFYRLPDEGFLFTGDSLIDFADMDEGRMRYNSLADFLLTSVNVDSGLAREERVALKGIADEDGAIVCGGHGPMARFVDGRLVTVSSPWRVMPSGGSSRPSGPQSRTC